MSRIKNTFEVCQTEALKYNSRSEFNKNSPSIYKSAYRLGYLDEVCKHMKLKCHQKYTNDELKEICLQYDTIKELIKYKPSIYSIVHQRGLTSEMFSHMKSLGNHHKRCIYVYEFKELNYAYIGLTYNINIRHNEHKIRGSVYKFYKKNNITPLPLPKQLTKFIETKEAIKLEEYWLNHYKSNGWNIINKVKTGSVGGITKWEKIIVFHFNGDFYQIYENINFASNALKIKRNLIRACLRKRWRYVNDFRFLSETEWKNMNCPIKLPHIEKRTNIQAVVMLTKTGEFIQKFKSIRDAEIYVGCKPDSGGIIKVCKGKQKTAYGYIWRYENEVDKFVGGFKK